jgi:DNA polymerase (family 10)
MNKKEVAKILEEIGIILDLKDENPFKIRAYYNGARIIETLDTDIKKLVESGEIARIKGIGQALSEKISVLVTTGSLPFYEELKSSIPEGLLSMLKIPGLGAKKVKIIHENLAVTTVGELEYACRENRLRDLQGFGQKSQDKILQSIERLKKYSKRFLFPVAEEIAQEVLEYLKKNIKLKIVAVAGSLRRKMETVKDLDIIGCCENNDREELMEYFVNYDQSVEITGKGMTKAAIILNTGITVELRLVDEKKFPFLLLHVTGGKEYNTQMRRLAKENKMILNEYGLFRGDQLIACSDEKEIFKNLGLPFIPPELREGMGEIDAAKEGTLPELYDGIPFYGLFHVHTTYSDGANTIEEMVQS